MGKGKTRFRKGNRDRDNKQQAAKWREGPVNKNNELFNSYYKAQNIVNSEEEWKSMLDAFRRELPASFRIVGCRSVSKPLLDILLDRYLNKLDDLEVDGKLVEKPVRLPWYPDGLAFQMNLSRATVRKNMVLNGLHNFLVTETELGNISRQETVSMVPPLFLDVKPEHSVLDMCAAPGSKTAQIVEMLLQDENQLVPEGFVVANDSDNKRCYLLVHQSLKRLENPCCLVINHDAANLPNIAVTDDKGEKVQLKYDRVLCDVPCSGDGTLRKNLDVWNSWSPNSAHGLHSLQTRILTKGLQLLKDNGQLVYSTCSLNPVENEAVIARVIQDFNGSVELLDVSHVLPELNRNPGLTTWKVMDKLGSFYSTFDDIEEEKKNGCGIPKSAFPTKEDLHLERCLRIPPHLQDTGGFFVAVLRKKKALDVDEAGDQDKVVVNPSSNRQRKMKHPRFQGFRETPFVFLENGDDRWKNQLQPYYGIDDSFKYENLFGRSVESVTRRNLYLVNSALKNILVNNTDSTLKMINAGIRIFSRNEGKQTESAFRLSQEGIPILRAYMSKRMVNCEIRDVVAILVSQTGCRFEDLSKPVQEELQNQPDGSIIMSCQAPLGVVSVCTWKGKVTLSPYVAIGAKLHLLRLLQQDTTTLEDGMVSSRKRKAMSPPESIVKGDSTDSLQDEAIDIKNDEKIEQNVTE